MSELIDEIFERARDKNVPQTLLASKAGVRPETLSRLKHRDNCDVRTLENLALAVGYQLALVPLEQGGKYQLYSPRERAREKAASRRHDAELIASGQATREQIQRRNAFFSIPNVEFPLLGLSRKKKRK